MSSPIAPLIGFIAITIIMVTNAIILKLISDDIAPLLSGLELAFIHRLPLFILLMGILASVVILTGILKNLGINKLIRRK